MQSTKTKHKKKDGVSGKAAAPAVRAFNVMDAKQILQFTKERLNFLSSNHQDKLQLHSVREDKSAIKDFNHDNNSDANLLRNQPAGDNFNDILNAHVSDFMQGEADNFQSDPNLGGGHFGQMM